MTTFDIFIFFLFINCSLTNFQGTIYSPAENYKLAVGESVEFECSVSHPENITSYYWTKENILSHNTECHYTPDCQTGIRQGNVVFMTLNNIQVQHQGTYKCQVFWNSLRATLNHTLVVLVPPKLKPFNTTDYFLEEGESLSLPCQATGIPTPTISWNKNSYDIDTEDQSRLTIQNAVPADWGEYRCSAENEVDEDWQSINVYVFFKPQVTVLYEKVYCGTSYRCSMTCSFTGYEEVDVEWSHPVTSKYDIPASWKQDDKRLSPTEVISTLVIQQASPDDIGNYTCTGSNEKGVVRGTVYLTFEPTMPNITSLNRPNFYSDRYLLEWTVTSYSKLLTFETVFHYMKNHNTSQFLNSMNITAREIKLPAKYHPIRMPIRSFNYVQSEMLAVLKPSSKYTVQMRAFNTYGNSDWTPVGALYTAELGGSLNGASPILTSTLTTIITCVFHILSHF